MILKKPNVNIRFACLVAVVSSTGLARSDWCVVDELEQVLSVACNDGKLLAVLVESIELVVEGRLELLASNVGQLSLGDKGLCLCADKLLLENHNLWAVWLLVLELSDLVSDLLLTCIVSVLFCCNVVQTHGLCLAGRKLQCCGCSSW